MINKVGRSREQSTLVPGDDLASREVGRRAAGRCAPPLCWCCTVTPVNPSPSRTRPHQTTADGAIWRRYCSRSCAAKGNGSATRGNASFRSYMDGYRDRVLTGILTALKPHTREIAGERLVVLKPLVSFILAERRTAYARGATAMYQRHRRGKAA